MRPDPRDSPGVENRRQGKHQHDSENMESELLEAAKLRRVRFHELRHTYASLLIQTTAPAKYIQEQLGHASIQVTMDVYGHLFIWGEYRHFVTRLDDGKEVGAPAPPPHPEPLVVGTSKTSD